MTAPSIDDALNVQSELKQGGNRSLPCVLCACPERAKLEAARLVRGLSYGAIARAMMQAEVVGVDRYPGFAALKAAVIRHFNHRENA